MRPNYDYRNCQSLFGYAQQVHVRSKAICQLCGCDAGDPPDFDLWRQMTVEHLIGRSQGGYPADILRAIKTKFPQFPEPDQLRLARQIDEANTVTACSFCNSMTSRDRHSRNMEQLLTEAAGTPDEVLAAISRELQAVLEGKRAEVQWKIQSVRRAFDEIVVSGLRSRP